MSVAQTGMGAFQALKLSQDRTQVLSYSGADAAVSIPDSVTTLPSGLFARCVYLQSVKLPSKLKVLPDRLFEGCTSLERVRLPDEVHTIGQSCFSGCTSLKTAPQCPGIEVIERDMFKDCTGLDAFDVPEGVEAIRSGAFSGCTALETVIFSATVETIEEGAFDGCTSLKRIRISDENLVFYAEEDGTLRRKSDGEIVLSPSAAESTHSVKLLHSENEIDLTPEGVEEDSPESLEAMNNNFIGDEEMEAGEENNIVSQGAAEDAKHLAVTDEGAESPKAIESLPSAESEKAVEIPNAREGNETLEDEVIEQKDTVNMASIEDILSQNILNRSTAEEAETKSEEKAAASGDELERITLESDILQQNITGGATAAASGDELGRIELESDILQQNIGRQDGEANSAAAESDELERIAMESDILQQNTRGGSEAGAGMEELILLSKESEILRDNTKVSNRITLTPTEAAAKIEGEEIEEAISADEIAAAVDAEKPSAPAAGVDSVFERIKSVAQKYVCIEMDNDSWAGLFVFAEKLSPSVDGEGRFSDALLRCCKRLVATHSLGRIHLFYGLPFDHAEFMQMFRQFILGKDAIYACDANSTKDLSPLARAFASCANIELDKESMAEQLSRAQEKGGRSFRVILRDDYDGGQ